MVEFPKLWCGLDLLDLDALDFAIARLHLPNLVGCTNPQRTPFRRGYLEVNGQATPSAYIMSWAASPAVMPCDQRPQ